MQCAGIEKVRDFFLKIEKLTWPEVEKSNGFDYKELRVKDFRNFPSHVSQDEIVIQLRIDKKFRIHGFRRENVFNITHLDKNHKALS